MSEFKDLFSKQSAEYARFRPTYPDHLFSYLASLVDAHELAWDVGTGSGQAALKLTQYFRRVVATDPSENQISRATLHPQVDYSVGSAEKAALAEGSVDLVTAAQAFHWFQQQEFFLEAQRTLKPNGVLAIWSYGLAKISPEVDSVVMKLYSELLGPYWEPERKLVEEGYRNVLLPLPFQEVISPPFEMSTTWSLEHLVGYLSTWSALQTFIQRNKTNPLEATFPDLKASWSDRTLRTTRWKLSLRVGRKTATQSHDS